MLPALIEGTFLALVILSRTAEPGCCARPVDDTDANRNSVKTDRRFIGSPLFMQAPELKHPSARTALTNSSSAPWAGSSDSLSPIGPRASPSTRSVLVPALHVSS